MYYKAKDSIENVLINKIYINDKLIKYILKQGIKTYLLSEDDEKFDNKTLKYQKIKIECSLCKNLVEKSYDLELLSNEYICKKCSIINKNYNRKKIDRRRKTKIDTLNNKLTIIGKNEDNKLYIIKCACGNIIERDSSSFRMISSCGCSSNNQKTSKESPHFSGYEDIHGHFWSRIKRVAKSRNLEFSITIQDAWNQYIKQNKKCSLSGLPIYFAKKISDYKISTASLDRIDSSKGYTLDNIQWVHKKINLMKMDLEQEEFLYICWLISNFK